MLILTRQSKGKSRGVLPASFGILALAALVSGCLAARQPKSMNAVPWLTLGLKLPGFAQEGPVVTYNTTNIFDYIDGEAELYLPNGFVELKTTGFRKENGGPLLAADFYDMTGEKGARAVFRRFAEQVKGTKIQGLGDEAFTDGLMLRMRRGRFFIRILPSDSASEKVYPKPEDLVLLARRIDAALDRY